MRLTNLTTLLLACGLGGAFSATAQTGRIAHFSHSGSIETLAAAVEAVDNLGNPRPVFTTDTIVATSDTTAVVHGTKTDWEGEGAKRDTRVIYYGKRYYQQTATAGPQSKAAAVKLLQQRYPEAKLIGFDTLAKPAAVPAPEAKKHKVKRKQKAVGAFFEPPAHPGVWLAIATMLGLAGVGLLLGDKPLKA